MSTKESTTASQDQRVHANGIDIHYLDQGEGEPLVLLHGGVVSTNPIWAGVPVAYASHMDTLAEHFRVIAAGHARLRQDRAHRRPDQLRPARRRRRRPDRRTRTRAAADRRLQRGRDHRHRPRNPPPRRNPSDRQRRRLRRVRSGGPGLIAMMRQILGGSPDATEPDPDAAARGFEASEQMRAMFELMKRDQDSGQGEGHWRTYLRLSWDRCTQPPGYTYTDLAKITAPTLILAGDRDDFCTVEQAVTAYRQLPDGELAILPGHGHYIPPAAIQTTVEFFTRRLAARP